MNGLSGPAAAFRTLAFAPGVAGRLEQQAHLMALAEPLGIAPCRIATEATEGFDTPATIGWLDAKRAEAFGPISGFPHRIKLNSPALAGVDLPPSPLRVIGETHLGEYVHVASAPQTDGVFSYRLSSARLLTEGSSSATERERLANLTTSPRQGGPGVVALTNDAVRAELGMDPVLGQFVIDQVVEKIRNNWYFHAALKLARANSKGKIYLVGSSVYRTLIEVLFGIEGADNKARDYDFLADKLTWMSHVPTDLKEVQWREPFFYGGPMREILVNPFQVTTPPAARVFSKPGLKVDVFTMDSFPTARRTQNGSLFDYFCSMPLTLQMLAFDVDTGEVLGLGGLPLGIASREIMVNDRDELQRAAARENTSTQGYAATKSSGLGFSVES